MWFGPGCRFGSWAADGGGVVRSLSRTALGCRSAGCLAVFAAALAVLSPAQVSAQTRIALSTLEVVEADVDVKPVVRVTVTGVPAAAADPLAKTVCYPYALEGQGSPVDARISDGGTGTASYGSIVVELEKADQEYRGAGVVQQLEIVGDDAVEGDEQIILAVYGRQEGATCVFGSALTGVPLRLSLTVRDDDRHPGQLETERLTVVETDEDAAAGLQLSFASDSDADYCFAFELAYARSTAGTDDAWVGSQKASSGRFILRAGSTRVVVRDVVIAGDDEVEGTETLYIDLHERQRGSSSCTSSGGSAAAVLTVTIEDDDDDTSGISPTEFTVVETDDDAPAALTLTFAQASDADYCFAFELAYGRSTVGRADAWVGTGKASTGRFVLPAGLTQVVLRDLIIAGDDEVEETETLYIDVYERQRGSSCGVGGPVAVVLTVTIEDDDQDTSGISPTEFTVTETDADASAALTLTFAQASDADYCFAFELAYGRSTAGRDDAWIGTGRSSRGSFVLPAGLTQVVLRDLIIAGDDEVEETETLYIDVYEWQRGSSCGVGGPVAVVLAVTIEDDDEDTSGISPTEFTVTETDADASAALTLTFAQASDADYCFAFELAYGRSTAGRDDAWIGTGRSSRGSFVLPAGLTQVVLRDLIIAGDDEVEETETLYIDVYERQRGSSCGVGGPVAVVLTVTIEDDDQDTSGISPTEFTVVETDDDAPAALTLTFAQAADSDYCFAFELAYGRSTAGRADAWVGTGKASTGRFVLPAGLTQVVLRDLIIAGDDEVEETETLYIDVYERQRSSSCRPAGTVAVVLTVTIEDDDRDTSGISPTEFTVTETDVDAPAALALTFAQLSDADYCFAFELAYGRSTAGAADAWVGPGRSSTGTFVLPAGLTQVVLRDLIIAGDDEVEETETLYIDVYERQRSSSCGLAGTVVAVLTVTIEDDDQDTSGISSTEFAVVETDEDAPAALALTFVQAADSDYCFAFELAYGRSTAGRDDAWVGPQKASSGSFVLPAGLTEVVVRDLIVAGDNLPEASETLQIDVYDGQRGSSCGVGGTVIAVLTVTIEDDDEGVQIEFTLTPLLVQEPVRRRQAVVFDLQQSGGPEFSSFTVEWSTAPGTAQTDGSTPDYEPAGGSLTFDSGAVRRYISIVLFGDLVREPDETFFVSVRSVLSSDVSVVSEARFEVTITEVDRECLTVPDEVQVPEGPSGARAGVVVPVQVGCLVAERRTLVVSASETGGRKAARGSPPDQDFEPVDGLVHVVPAGVFEVEVPVTVVLGDNRPEPATETFSVSVELDSDSGSAGLRGTTTVVILDDEVYFDEIVTLETPASMPEGDPPFGADCGAHLYRPLPDPCARGVPLLLTLNERFSQDLEFELYTLAETARADVDYESIRGRRLVVREGHLVSFDVHEPLQLRVVPDLLPEPQEALSLFLYGRYPGNPVPAFAQRIRIVIEDDDELADGTDVPWFGPDAELCGDGESVLAVQEPSVTDGLGLFRVDLAYRVRRRSEADADAGQVNELLSCDLPAAAAVEVRVDLVSPGLSNAADAGLDVVLPDHSRRLVFYRGQPAPIELFVRGDGLPEGREELDLLLSTGQSGHTRLRVVVEDFEATVEAARGRAASLVRAGRLLGAALTDAVAARFSCAGSSACAPFEDSREALFPQRLAGALRALWPMHARGAGPGGPGAGCAGPRCLGLGTDPAHAPGSLERAGRLVEALAFQGDPQRWLFGGRSRRASPWSLWLRGSARTDRDATAGGSALETGLVTALTGVDRIVGRLRVGGVYGWSFGAYSRRHARGSFVPDRTDVPLRWHLVAPYVGFVPTDRARFWASAGAGWGGSHVLPADGSELSGTADPEPSVAVLHYGRSGASQRLRLYAGGGAFSLGSLGAFEFDLEGDWFRVRVVHGGAGVIADASPASRLRVGVRAGTRLGAAGSSSYLSFAVARRWDAGADVEWVRGAATGEAAGATDAAVDYSFRRPRSRLAWTATVQMQVAGGGSAPGLVTASGVALQRSVSRMTASGGLRWGSSETGRGWSLALRPGYGFASLRRSAWWDAAALGGIGAAFPAVVPTLDAEVGYGFAGGGQAAVTFGQGFPAAGRSGRGVSVGVRFDRGW